LNWRAGIRNNNDLVWIGRAPSLAAKLSDIREPRYSVYINEAYSNGPGDGEKSLTAKALGIARNGFWSAKPHGLSHELVAPTWLRRCDLHDSKAKQLAGGINQLSGNG
jgi:hypothetical protein